MELKKLPNSLTTEELLELADKPNKEAEVLETSKNDVLRFLTTYNIKPGKQTVKKRLLYDLYRKWSDDPLESKNFNLEVGKYLLVHFKGIQAYYCINRKGFRLAMDIEELYLKHSKDKTKVIGYKKHFDSFLKHYELKPGKYYIETFVLYTLYDKWTYKNGANNPLGYNQFYNFCKLYFTKKRKTSNRVAWFGVNKSSIDKHLTKEELAYIRQGRQHYASKKDKTKSKKK